MTSLVIAEHDNASIKGATLNTVTAALACGGDVHVLVTGANGMLPSYAVHTLLGLNDARGAGIRVVGLVRNEQKARRVLAPVLDRAP